MHERNLTAEFIVKSDKDIATINTLNEIAKENGAFLVLAGGYATEAICGGKITRPHGDIDVRFILSDFSIHPKEFKILMDARLENEPTKWKLWKESTAKLEYRENAEGVEFFKKRRIELYFVIEGVADAKFDDTQLIDSNGKTIYVKALSLKDLVVSKVKALYGVRNGYDPETQRETDLSDLADLHRLISLNVFDKDAVIENLSKKSGIEKAQEQWDYAQSQLKSYVLK